ncbi:inositol oxygenase [Zychaea mexicana]|uniref:inositol oxygenase n=1 Tax=Zychaea mexicana TaxID=64656 RepID=UPI0022FE4083|nr:inositol oxygenase [Zychaea mexicana]KAI9490484.1 inositol oxygenase [Zychaea mexicana]
MKDISNLSEAARVTEAWEEYLITKYGSNKSSKETAAFRNYETALEAQPTVSAFYKENHEKQTVAHVLAMKEKYRKLDKAYLGIWEVLEILNGLVDESDPDIELPQTVHALQSAEAARRDGQPRWMILVALIHDLGKYMFFEGEAQWTVVGDTFPVGCQYSNKIVHPEYFVKNPDYDHPVYSTKHGIYEPNCGLDKVHLSFGHDEYMAMVCKDYLPPQALYIIRNHSFYSCHTEGSYSWLLSETDTEMMKWVKIFNQYDLYSKAEKEPDVEELKPFYQELIAEYFPEKIRW